jgi:phage tail-like protein
MATGDRVDPYKNFRFLVEIDGIVQAGFNECSGFGSEVEVVEYREGGDVRSVRKLTGKATFPDVSLKWGITDSRELYDWHLAALNGQLERKNGSIILQDDVG